MVNFKLVTNRNALSESALKVLQSSFFIEQIKQFLNNFYNKDVTFKELVKRLKQEKEEVDRDGYVNAFNDIKASIQHRPRFMVEDVEYLKGKWLVAPMLGEEHWVGALYTLFSHLIPENSPYSHLWLRPRTFSSIGIDSIAVACKENKLTPEVHQGLEYKYIYSASEIFNHMLTVTTQIVCWEISPPLERQNVKDNYGYFGVVDLNDENLQGIGYTIVDVQTQEGDYSGNRVKVIGLKDLIDKTFKCKWFEPPSPANARGTPSGKRGGTKRKK
jgi:hypothetical protein